MRSGASDAAQDETMVLAAVRPHVASATYHQPADSGWPGETPHTVADFDGGSPYRDAYYDAPAGPRANLGVVIAVGVAVVAAVVVGVSLVTLGGGGESPAAAPPPQGATEVVTPTNPVTTSPTAEASSPSEAPSSSTSATTSAAPHAAPIIGAGSAKCMDIPGAHNADGSQLDLFTCNGTAAQAWTYNGDGTVRAMGKCLDVRGADRRDKTAVQVFTCNGTAAQRWSYDPRTGELKTLGKCLDASGASTADNTPLILYTCNKGTNQQWHIASLS
ncbi:RICIN domain-containing protein [Catenulispora subtropica]